MTGGVVSSTTVTSNHALKSRIQVRVCAAFSSLFGFDGRSFVRVPVRFALFVALCLVAWLAFSGCSGSVTCYGDRRGNARRLQFARREIGAWKVTIEGGFSASM